MDIHNILGASVGFNGAMGCALFVACLAITLFVVVRYYRSLRRQGTLVRTALVSFRFISLLLIACAIWGLTVTYKVRRKDQILIRGEKSTGPANGDLSAAEKTVRSSLKDRTLEGLPESGLAITGPPGPSAVVLFTDGAFGLNEAERLLNDVRVGGGGAPVYVVLPDEPTNANVVLESVTMVRSPIRNVPLQFKCVVRGVNAKDRETIVAISDDARVQNSARVRWKTNDEEQEVLLEVVPKYTGFINYGIKVEGLGGESPESLKKQLSVLVEDRRYRLLFFEGEPTWDGKFIRRALDASKMFDVDYFARVSRSAVSGQSAADGEEKQHQPQSELVADPVARLHTILSDSAILNKYDGIIVGATPSEMISAPEASHLREWIEKRGGGLILLGSNNFNGSVAAPNGRLNSLMPAAISGSGLETGVGEAAGTQPVESRRNSGTLQLSRPGTGDSSNLRAFFMMLEETKNSSRPLSGAGFVFGSLRPGSTLLATMGNGPEDIRSTRPGMVSMPLGYGQVLGFAPSDSWRLKTEENNSDPDRTGIYETLWQGLVLQAVSGARANPRLYLSTEIPKPSEEISVSLDVLDRQFNPRRADKVSARLQRTDGESAQQVEREIPLKPDLNTEGRWKGSFHAPEQGVYALTVRYVAGDANGVISKQFAVSSGPAPRSGAARDALEILARRFGGRLFKASEVQNLSAVLLSRKMNDRSIEKQWELLNWWPLALILPLLLSLEWFTQRLFAERS
jgi:hypothetical protein